VTLEVFRTLCVGGVWLGELALTWQMVGTDRTVCVYVFVDHEKPQSSTGNREEWFDIFCALLTILYLQRDDKLSTVKLCLVL